MSIAGEGRGGWTAGRSPRADESASDSVPSLLHLFRLRNRAPGLPPLLGILQREFGINHGTASLVMSLFLAPFVLTAIPAGMAADRFGVPVTGRTGGALMLAGTLVTLLAGSWPLVLAGRAIAGAGAAFCSSRP